MPSYVVVKQIVGIIYGLYVLNPPMRLTKSEEKPLRTIYLLCFYAYLYSTKSSPPWGTHVPLAHKEEHAM